MTTYIYGASDDLVEFEGDFREEFGLSTNDEAYFKITGPETGDYLYVVARYTNLGWMLGVVQPPDEDDNALLPWEVAYEAYAGATSYSITLAVETPENVVVTEVDRNGREILRVVLA